MGAWIEITNKKPTVITNFVAPLVGAWIEIDNSSLVLIPLNVAPLVGAWIEIILLTNPL